MEVKLLLDTNRYRDLTDGMDEVVEHLEVAERVWLPFVVLAELRAGFAVGRRGRQNEGVLQTFLTKPGVGVVYPDDTTTRSYASLFRQLRQQGTPIPTNGLWIAALAVQHNFVLYTRDEHFEHLPQTPRL